ASATTDSVSADGIARAMQDSVNRAQPGYVVDSIFLIAEEMRRFNEGLVRPDSLTGGATTRTELVRKFTAALARHDTSSLRQMHVTRAEFGHFVFLESPYSRPPYKTKPGLIWLQLMSESERGMSRLLERVAGNAVRISDLQCEATPDRQGPNRYWRNCTMMVRDGNGRSRRLHLFGQILERDGRAKFLSYDTSF
ncbi:MAG: hypothetical protein ACREOG_15505, partial [Gemmatimonadaceae bacterium]